MNKDAFFITYPSKSDCLILVISYGKLFQHTYACMNLYVHMRASVSFRHIIKS
jgi:hypothetical protein